VTLARPSPRSIPSSGGVRLRTPFLVLHLRVSFRGARRSSKPRVAGGWEDCPAFDLDPVGSRQGSAASVETALPGRGAKPKNGNRSPYGIASRQGLPLGEAEQAPLGSDSRPHSPALISAMNALSSPQNPVATAYLPLASSCGASPTEAAAAAAAAGSGATPNGSSPRANGDEDFCNSALDGAPISPPANSGQDSAADMYNSDNESLPAADSPVPQSATRDSRQHLQHRVALRLLERRGVLPDGGGGGGGGSSGRTSASGNSSSGGGLGGGCSPASLSSSGALEGGVSPSPPTLQQLTASLQSPTGGAGSGLVILSPNSTGRGSNGTDYYSAVSSPVVMASANDGADGGGGIPVETAVEVDERLCLQEDASVDPLDMRGTGYRMSAPGLGVRAAAAAMQGRAAWVAGGEPDSPNIVGASGALTADVADGDMRVRMRGSDFGGVMAGPLPESLFVRSRARANAAGGGIGDHTPRSAVVQCAGVDDDVGGGRGSSNSRPCGPPSPVWSAAGGRMELSQEEKEWLFGQPGGIGGLAPVMALGEGGEGLVDLVLLNLPTRKLHLARKATRTCLPAFALSTSGSGPAAAAAAVLGVRSQNVSYRWAARTGEDEGTGGGGPSEYGSG
jgi:hypothetical protein